ncbi:hypothetical protein B484DRAFT_201056 [Ochromonadaceae sp. CCMP2298]|nr:hypothetical protein B484DRAFT_201056 [Ochromonadaceae sp. CCMP2298]
MYRTHTLPVTFHLPHCICQPATIPPPLTPYLSPIPHSTFHHSHLPHSYGSDNKQGANWHPTRAFHMLRGESIAWIFALVLLEAVEALETALPGRSRESLREEYLQRLDELTPPPPKPKRCGLPLNCERRARCFTDYGPHYTGDTLGGLGGVVVGQTLWEYDDSESRLQSLCTPYPSILYTTYPMHSLSHSLTSLHFFKPPFAWSFSPQAPWASGLCTMGI